MTDLQESCIIAALQVAIMLMAMRCLYGGWPWEYRKTWYATRHAFRKIAVEPPKEQLEYDLPEIEARLTVLAHLPQNTEADSFERAT